MYLRWTLTWTHAACSCKRAMPSPWRQGAAGAGVPEYHWGTDGGTFYLRTDDTDASLWKDVTFTVTVPRGTVFRTVRLSTGMGSMKLQGLACTEKAEIDVGMGSIELEGSLAGNIRVDCGMGSAELRIPGRRLTATA